jgi:hypothetical protein
VLRLLLVLLLVVVCLGPCVHVGCAAVHVWQGQVLSQAYVVCVCEAELWCAGATLDEPAPCHLRAPCLCVMPSTAAASAHVTAEVSA